MANTSRSSDPLEPLSLAVGALLVLIGVATVAGGPWATKITLATAAVQVGAALLLAALGVGVALLGRR